MEVGNLWVKLGLNKDNYDKGINEAKSGASGFGGFMKNAFGFAVGAGMFDLMKTGLKSAWDMSMGFNSNMEQSSAAFTTLLGDASKAKNMIADLSNFAASTPFEMSDLNKASQTLLGFGIDSQKVMPYMKMLGDVSMGNKDKFQSLTLAFSQIQSAGKMTGQDLMQLINGGFNPLQVMSQQTGLSMAQLKDKMEKGAISADMVTSAFQSATSEGGLFYGAMDKQSKTFEGQMSTLQDTLNQIFGGLLKDVFNNLSTNLLPRIIGGLGEFQTALSNGANVGVALREAIKGIFGDEIAPKILNITDKIWGLGQALVGFITGDTEAMFTGLADWMGVPVDAADTLTNALSGIRDAISGAFQWVVDNGETVKTIVAGIATAFVTYKAAVLAATIAQEAQNAVSAIMAIAKGKEAIQTLLAAGAKGNDTIAQWLLNAAMSANPIMIVILVIAALVGALVYLWNTNEGFRNALIGAWNAIKDGAFSVFNAIANFFVWVWDGIKSATIAAWNFIKNNIGAILPIIAGLIFGPIGAVLAYVVTHWDQVKSATVNAFTAIVNWLKALPGNLYNIAVNMIDYMRNGITSTIGNVRSAVVNGIDAAMDYVKSIPAKALEWGKDIINGIVNGIKNAAGAVGDAVSGVAQEIRKFLHFSVPDEGPLADFDTYMPDMIDGLVYGIKGNKNKITTAVEGMAADMSIGIKGSMTGVSTVINQAAAGSAGGGYKTANITFEVDGRTMARAIGKPLTEEIRLKTGVRM
ncbi:MAG: tape measure protein [Clostridiaceae bacterium]